jgi:predicted AlkP superfamily phosphohydrolase/phosphomutase
VEGFRRGDLDRLRADLFRSVDQRFDVFAALLREHDWTFAIMVEMALDRAHHAFWHHAFADHPLFVADSPFATTILELYAHVDERVGALLAELDLSDTTVLVLSDHGAQSMMGGFCVNEWLRQQGHLACFHAPEGVTPLAQCRVDWSRSAAWAEGGYCARIYLNVRGREPSGCVSADEAARLRAHLRAELEALTDPAGEPMGNVVFEPTELYPTVRGIAPDLIAYLGGLRWRAIGSVGHEGWFVSANDTGPDGANHTAEGLWIASGAGVRPRSEPVSMDALDVAPTILRALDLPVPAHVEGTAIEL